MKRHDTDPHREGSGALGPRPVEKLLDRASRRIRRHRVLALALWGLCIGFASATAVVVFHRLVGPEWELWPVAASMAGAAPLLVAVAAFVVLRRDLFGAALALERRYALDERLSSILFLSKERVPAEAAGAVIRDGERHVGGIDVRKALPLVLSAFMLPLILVLITAVTFTGVYAGLPEIDVFEKKAEREKKAAEQKRVERRNKRLRKRLEQLRKEADKRDVSLETRKVLEKLAQRKQLEKRKGTQHARRQALVNVERMRKEVQNLKERPRMKGLKKFLDNINTQTGMRIETPQMKNVAKALTAGDIEAAAKHMEQLANMLQKAQLRGPGQSPDGKQRELTPEELARLQKDLAQLAKLFKDVPGLDASQLAGLNGPSGMSAEDLADLSGLTAEQLADLARLMREQLFIDQMQQEIEFTADELAALDDLLEEGELCEDCKNGRPCGASKMGGC